MERSVKTHCSHREVKSLKETPFGSDAFSAHGGPFWVFLSTIQCFCFCISHLVLLTTSYVLRRKFSIECVVIALHSPNTHLAVITQPSGVCQFAAFFTYWAILMLSPPTTEVMLWDWLIHHFTVKSYSYRIISNSFITALKY